MGAPDHAVLGGGITVSATGNLFHYPRQMSLLATTDHIMTDVFLFFLVLCPKTLYSKSLLIHNREKMR